MENSYAIACEAMKNARSILVPKYGEREAVQMTKIIFEDVFEIFNHMSKRVLTEDEMKMLNSFLYRLIEEDVPIQYLTGVVYFYGYKMCVDERVLIPRPETEELVHWVLSDIKRGRKGVSLLDIGTGSGCIPIAIKKENNFVNAHGMDISKDALTVAKKNEELNQVEIRFFQKDVLKLELPFEDKYDIIISNPPYIGHDERDKLPFNVVNFEPEGALFVPNGSSPVVFYKKIVDLAIAGLLKNGGDLYFELSEYYAQRVIELVKQTDKFNKIEIRKDMQGMDRMLKAVLKDRFV